MKRKNRNRFAIVIVGIGIWSEHKSRRAAQKSLENARSFGYTADVVELIGA